MDGGIHGCMGKWHDQAMDLQTDRSTNRPMQRCIDNNLCKQLYAWLPACLRSCMGVYVNYRIKCTCAYANLICSAR